MNLARAVLSAAVLLAAGAAASLVLPHEARGGGEAPRVAAPAECRACHVEACDRWEKSAHALSMRPALRGIVAREIAAEQTVEHAPGATTFHGVGADRFEVETAGDDGKPARFPLDWIVGVRRMNFFVTTMPDGRLQVLPPMREIAGPWFDYTKLLFAADRMGPAPDVKPGEPSFWTGPDRSFDAKCARCHTSGAEPVEAPGGKGPRTKWRSVGIDCDSCHGDGAPHVKHRNTPGADPLADPIPSLSGLGRAETLRPCLPCHIEGEVLDRRPTADPLERIEPTLLDDVVRVDASARPRELMYEGLAFLTSTCSDRGQLTCLNCHEVHGSPKPFSLKVSEEKDVELCRRCHTEIAAKPDVHAHHKAGATGVLCTGCHMPPIAVERGHGAVRDHTIGIPRPHRDETADDAVAKAQDGCTWCHTGGRGAPAGVPRLSFEQLDAAYAKWWPDAKRAPSWAAAIEGGRRGDEAFAPDLVVLAKDTATPRLVRASALRLLAPFADAVERDVLALARDADPVLRRAALHALTGASSPESDAALLAALSDPSPGVRYVAARSALDGWKRVQASKTLLAAVLPVLAEDAAADPQDHLRWFRLGAARQIAGDAKGAIDAYERKLALDPGAKAVRETVARLRAKLK